MIEVTPAAPADDPHGGVCVGPVGAAWAGRLRIFRYEVRCWRNGQIPDVSEAVASPRTLSEDEPTALRMLGLVAKVPTPTWGRDESGTGDMWNSNSVISWLIVRAGIDCERIQPPDGGRAPGWLAGLEVASRQGPASDDSTSSMIARDSE